MTTPRPPAVRPDDDGPTLRVERGPDRQLEVVLRIGHDERRVPFADFVAAQARHAAALRRTAMDRAAIDAARAMRRLGLRLRRRLVVFITRLPRPAPVHTAG